MNNPDRQAQVEKRLLAICPFALVFSLIVTLARGGEREGAFASLFSIGVPVIVTICVIVLGRRVLGRTEPGAVGRGSAISLMLLGIVAGAGVLIVRFNSGPEDLVSANQRSDPRSAEAQELRSALDHWADVHEKLKSTRWQAAAMHNKEQLSELGLEDLRATAAAQREFRDATQRVHELVTKLKERGTLPSVRRELISRGADPDSLNPDFVRIILRMTAAAHEVSALIEANWEDWRAKGLPAREEAVTPWQKNAAALMDEMISLQAEAVKKSESATAAK